MLLSNVLSILIISLQLAQVLIVCFLSVSHVHVCLSSVSSIVIILVIGILIQDVGVQHVYPSTLVTILVMA